MSVPEAFAVFSDDVRFEVGGKTSLMGIYVGALSINQPEMPPTLPRLAVTVFVRWPSPSDLEPLEILVFFPNQQVEPAIISKADPADTDWTVQPTPDRPVNIVLNAVLEGIPVTANGEIEVRVTVPSGTVTAGRLLIQHNPPEATPPSP